MFARLFTAHPRSIGESYLAHAAFAARFGGAMILGGLGCLVHAAVPGWCERAGSNAVRRLHARIAVRTPVHRPDQAEPEWQLSYVI